LDKQNKIVSLKWLTFQSLCEVILHEYKVVLLTNSGLIVGHIHNPDSKNAFSQLIDLKEKTINKIREETNSSEFKNDDDCIHMYDVELYPTYIMHESQPKINFNELTIFTEQIIGYSVITSVTGHQD